MQISIYDLFHCFFFCRSIRKPVDYASNNACDNKNKSKKNRKSPMKIRHVFRRSVKNEDSPDGGSPAPGALFGLPLTRVCTADGSPPTAVMVREILYFYQAILI